MGWELIATDSRGHLPECPGVYVLLRQGRAWYVGSSVNIRRRIRQHFMPYMGFTYRGGVIGQSDGKVALMSCDTVKFKRSCRFGDWLMWEARLIRRLRPAGNARGRGR